MTPLLSRNVVVPHFGRFARALLMAGAVGIMSLPEPVARAQDAARRAQGSLTPEQATARSQHKLATIGRAMMAYQQKHKTFPASAVVGPGGKTLLSWRVSILPFLGMQELYSRFKLDEPWDSPHNRELLDSMPAVYAPVDADGRGGHDTPYQVFVGPGTAFEGPTGLSPASFRDGPAATILVAEAEKRVPWTKPEDLAYAPGKPLPKIGDNPEVANALFADNSVRKIPKSLGEATIRSLITRAGGEKVDVKKLPR